MVPLLPSACLLGVLFISIFYLSAISTQRIGVAVTAVASKMSLVVTVLFAVIAFSERPSPLGWLGIVLALAAVFISSWSPGVPGRKRAWLLPVLLFFGTAAVDITLNTVQREQLSPTTESLFPTIVFGIAGILGSMIMAVGRTTRQLLLPRVLIGGVVLGLINYASLYFIVGALARSGFAASSVFPLMNIGVILFGTAISILAFGERLRRMQWIGIGCAVVAMALILLG